ncbi:MAG TPA: hypothetical protein VHN37_08965 [Actinomycetota bacterium]|nr:hypothetical protein [Actinomycetota bacterium]
MPRAGGTMRRLAGRFALTLVLLAAELSPLGGAAVAAEAPQTLAGTTVMAVREAAVADVFVPKTVRFWHPWFDPDRPDFRLDGGSGLAMFALVNTDDGEAPTGLVGGRLPEEGRSELFLTHVGLGPTGSAWKGFWNVPRGRYRLYVFADTPVRLALLLKSLNGTRNVRPDAAARYEVEEPPRLFGEGVAYNLYSAGATGTLEGSVAQFQLLWTREAAHLSSQTGFCWYDGEPSDATTAYVPGCPFADSQDIVEVTGDFVGEWSSIATGLRLPVPTGRSGQGMWFVSAAAIEDVGHLTAWLDLGLE